MAKLHITQDDHDYWMLSLEADDGTLSLVAHQFAAPDKLIEMAKELVEEGRVNAAIVVDPPRSRARVATAASEGYTKPAPRKAGE